MIGRVFSLAANTFRETVRNKILYVILAFALFVIGLTWFLADLSMGELTRIIADVGLTSIHLFGVIIAIFLGITLVSQEVDRKTIYLILSKPVPRWEFVVGKATGLSSTLLLTTALMAVTLFFVHVMYGGKAEPGILVASAGIYLELVLLVCIATFFSTFTTPTLSAMFTLALFLIGHLSRSPDPVRRTIEGGGRAGRLRRAVLPASQPRDLQPEERSGARTGEVPGGTDRNGRVFRLLRRSGPAVRVPSLRQERFQVNAFGWDILPLAAFSLAFLLSIYLTPIFRDAAREFGIVDAPDGKLKNQTEPVAYLGGMAVFGSVLFTAALFLRFSDKLSGLLLATAVIVLLGLIDDIGRLSPRIKLLVQVISVFLMMKAGIRIRIEAFPPLLCVALTFAWMIVMTNGFNLIDRDGRTGLRRGRGLVGVPRRRLPPAGQQHGGDPVPFPQRRPARFPEVQPPPGADLSRRHRVPRSRVPSRRAGRRGGLHGEQPLRVDRRSLRLRSPPVRGRLRLLPAFSPRSLHLQGEPGPLQPEAAPLEVFPRRDGRHQLCGSVRVRGGGAGGGVPRAHPVPLRVRNGLPPVPGRRGISEKNRHGAVKEAG